MIFLAISILSSTGIFVLFKLFRKYNVNTLHALIVNYITAVTCGLLIQNKEINLSDIIGSSYFYAAICLGFLFISIFYVMALTAQRNGLSVASVASKMSVIIPVLFGIIIYNEGAGMLKIIGIILALFAVYLTSVKPKSDIVLSRSIYLPIILFLGSGIIDTGTNHFSPENEKPLFLALIFGIAGSIGILISTYQSLKKKLPFKIKTIPFGVALGLVNYSSMHYLLKALRVEGFESSTIFTVNNVAIVALSTLFGLVIFKEKISSKNWIGIGIALISIVLVTLY